LAASLRTSLHVAVHTRGRAAQELEDLARALIGGEPVVLERPEELVDGLGRLNGATGGCVLDANAKQGLVAEGVRVHALGLVGGQRLAGALPEEREQAVADEVAEVGARLPQGGDALERSDHAT